jgi:Regulator of chromosome condensation (RCC1) repeat
MSKRRLVSLCVFSALLAIGLAPVDSRAADPTSIADGLLLASGQTYRFGGGGLSTVLSDTNFGDIESADIKGGVGTSAVVKSDGTVWVSGWNDAGQLGDGTIDRSYKYYSPRPVTGLSDIVKVRVSQFTVLALTRDGRVFQWGTGPGSYDSATRPTLVPGLSEVKSISSWYGFHFAVTRTGDLYVWGDAYNQQNFGYISIPGYSGSNIVVPTKIAVEVEAFTSGSGSTGILVFKNGQVESWRYSSYDRFTKSAVSLPTIKEIDTGFEFSVALGVDGSVWTWGGGFASHEITYGSEFIETPRRLNGLPPITHIAAGYSTGFALDQSGQLWAWGRDGVIAGRIGSEGVVTKQPVRGLQGTTGWSKIFAGKNETFISGNPQNTVPDPLNTTLVRLPARNVCLLAGSVDAVGGSCSAPEAKWRTVVKSNGRFNLLASDGRCLQNTGALGGTCTDFFALKGPDGLRDIRWGQRVADKDWTFDGLHTATPCLGVTQTVAAVYAEPACPENRESTGWEISLPQDTSNYGLGDWAPTDPRIGTLFLTGKNNLGFRCTATVVDSKNTVATAAHCFTELGKIIGTNQDNPFSSLRSVIEHIYFIPGFSKGAGLSAPYGIYSGKRWIINQDKYDKTTDWAFIEMVPADQNAVLIAKGYIGASYAPRTTTPLSQATGYYPIAFLGPRIRRMARAEPLKSFGYPGNLYGNDRLVQCQSPKRPSDKDNFSCFMEQGSSGGPVMIAGQVRGTNESTDGSTMRPALFGINACQDYMKLIGGTC